MRLARPLHTRFWLIALFAIASVMAVIWLGGPNLTQSQNPGTPVPASLESTEAVLQIGQSIPDFELADLDGNTVRFSSLSGRPVVINFWATWCAPCRAEMRPGEIDRRILEAKASRLLEGGTDNPTAGQPN